MRSDDEADTKNKHFWAIKSIWLTYRLWWARLASTETPWQMSNRIPGHAHTAQWQHRWPVHCHRGFVHSFRQSIFVLIDLGNVQFPWRPICEQRRESEYTRVDVWHSRRDMRCHLPRPILSIENVQRDRYVPNVFDGPLACFGRFGNGHIREGDIVSGACGHQAISIGRGKCALMHSRCTAFDCQKDKWTEQRVAKQ